MLYIYIYIVWTSELFYELVCHVMQGNYARTSRYGYYAYAQTNI